MSPADTPQPFQHQQGRAVATCPRRQGMASRQILVNYMEELSQEHRDIRSGGAELRSKLGIPDTCETFSVMP